MSLLSTYKQYLKTKSEVETSINDARSLKDKWLVAINENPTNLTRKEIDRIGKDFKNKLLTVKWDYEDLEELVNVCENSKISKFDQNESIQARCFITDCRNEISKMMDLMEEIDSNSKIYQKHGISLPTTSTNNNNNDKVKISPTTSLIKTFEFSNNNKKYERLLDNNNNNNNNNVVDPEEVQFDKTQLEQVTTTTTRVTTPPSTTTTITSPIRFNSNPLIFNNALYDHLEQRDQDNQQQQFKFNNSDFGSNFNNNNNNNRSQVFNNLSRPVTNVYMNPNDNEVILDMLETEYYNPPAGLQTETRFNYTLRKILETSRNRLLGTIAFLFSFPILIVLFFTL